MATTYKNSQIQGTTALTTYATLYNTTASTTAVISSIVVANTTSTAQQIRIGLDTTAGTPGASEWLVYDAYVAGNDTLALTLGITLGNTQYIRVSSTANTVAFTAFISEIS